MKKSLYCLLCLLAVLFSYLLIRFPLFSLHGMKDWPLFLALADAAVILFCLIFRDPMLPVFAAGGYLLGFVLGLIFRQSGVDGDGGRTDSLWLIWTNVLLISLFLGILVKQIFLRRRKS